MSIELLAPGGDIEAIKAAIAAGADAIYCGLNKFNARNRATNISFDDLHGILRLAHNNQCKVYLTINIIVLESEIPDFIRLLNRLVNTPVDGVIIQDLGIFYLVSKYFNSLNIHASTQFTTHNEGQILFLNKLNASRVNLSRELNLKEIKALSAVGHQNNILTEVFVHGSLCISFSGICYLSSVHGGNSGNRGRCSQPCRDRYLTTPEGKDYPLNLKDNSAFFDLRELVEAGVDSLKIEGRIKKFDYVYTVVDSWKKQIQRFYNSNSLSHNNSDLYKVFNRDFSNSYLKGGIHKDMFIDNPRDYTLAKNNVHFEEIEESKASIENTINQLSIERAPLFIDTSGKLGSPLTVFIKTPDRSFTIFSKMNLVDVGAQALNHEMLLKKLRPLNDTAYYIKELKLNHLSPELFIPFKELNSLKNQVLFILNDSKEIIAPIDVPHLKKQKRAENASTLSVLISSREDLHLCNETEADIYFQLPNSFRDKDVEILELFQKNKALIPWFPSVLIGKDYSLALEFLHKLQPKQIVTNNLGIAYEASKNSVSWIAGPYLNVVNSWSLLCLKEKFNCSGSFISNEINKEQIMRIKKPEDFSLYYSIYHPIVLMTSRQCLFHQVTGCIKNIIDDMCISQCEKSASITNLKKASFIIGKTKGNYHCLYNNDNYLNTDIVTELPDLFSSYFIDLSDVNTETKIAIDKTKIIAYFQNLIYGQSGSERKLKQVIHPSINTQYRKGI